MTARAVWKGSIHFGLVSIPIELYTAIQPHVLGFKLLHEVCNTPISNKRWCAHCDKEVAWEETVKGLKLKDGTYFILTQENIKKLKPERTDTIDVVEFVDVSEISPLYYDQHYYVAPAKKNDKAFFLFLMALERFKKAAVGQFVMRDKEYVCLLQPHKNTLIVSTLNYAYEIKHVSVIDELKVPATLPEQELKLAELLMSKLYKKSFDISEFKDTFATRLAQAIKLKQKGKVVAVEKKPAAAPPVSLMEALKASLSQYERPAAERRRAR